MRILILSISERSGHQHAAQALEDAIRLKYPKVETINRNFFNYISNPWMEKVINSIYFMILHKTPKFWEYIYDNDKVFEYTVRFRKIISKSGTAKFKLALDKIHASAIVCTQALPCEIASNLKKAGKLSVPLVAIVTDFVAHAYWAHPEVDLYIVPSERTKQDLVRRGVSPGRVKILGLPINPIFEKRYAPEEIIELRNKLGLQEYLPTVLVMGGSHGFGPIKEVIETLNKSKIEMQILVVTGLKTELRRNLRTLETNSKNPLFVYGYVNNIQELMSVSHLLITKPGGMTSTEALNKRIPMIIVDPLPGQERKNRDFLVNAGAVVSADTVGHAAELVEELLGDEKQIALLQRNMEELVIHHSTQKIVEAIMELLKEVNKKELSHA